ncbi:MAG: beta-ketoacyl-ACP reductase [Holosporaceae bacterium]|nr:beta-ketoacyl-ACP reductase [Holosporaceae bacterium]
MKKIALVTGGTKGIGAAICRSLSEAGYLVAANYGSDRAAANKFHLETGIPVFQWDVSSWDACQKSIGLVCEHFGGIIDVLVNNAGITKDRMLHKMNLDEWRRVIAVNLDSVFNMSRAVIVPMREKGSGRIINMSSINGIKGQLGQTNYSAAKAGIIGFTKALALESAVKGITVNAIAPGYICTDMTEKLDSEVQAKIIAGIPIGRFGTVDEISRAVLFLADEKSSYITGITLNINGGQYL